MARSSAMSVGLAAALWSANARAETLPELPVDDEVVAIIEALAPGEAVRLPEFTVVGEGLDAYETFATRGPGIRDFCRKWVWAEDRGRALYAGGNHGVPHKFNDLWEYDLESNTWVMLHAPDPGVKPSHTWWGLTYDPTRASVVWMAPTSPGVWDAAGYEGPPMRVYDTQAQNGWELAMVEPPYIRVSLASSLEYIPGRDVMLFHSNNWNGSGLQQYDPVANAWTELIPQEELYFDNPDAPPAEAIITYNPAHDVLVGFQGRSVYVYAFDDNAWTRVLEDIGDEDVNVSDSRAGSDYDPNSELHWVLFGERLFAYDVASNAMTELAVEGLPDYAMVYVDRELGVLVAYDDSPSVMVYRHATVPDPGDESGGSSEGEGSSSSGAAEGSTSGAAPASTSTGSSAAEETSSAPQDEPTEANGCACRTTRRSDPFVCVVALAIAVARRRRRSARRGGGA